MPDDTSRMRVRGKTAYHVLSCATWCEYMVIGANYVVKVEPSMNAAHASFISCGFSTGFGAAWKEAKVHKGSSVAVLGLGAVGLGAISGAKMMGARKIIGIDRNEKKREKGEAFGMTHFINPSASSANNTLSDLVKELSDNGMGVDYSFECTGVAPLLNQAMEATKMIASLSPTLYMWYSCYWWYAMLLTRNNSKLGIGETIAIGSGNGAVAVNYSTILYGRRLKGTVFGGIKPFSHLPSFIAHHKQEIPLHELLTHEVPLGDISRAIELFKQPDCVKVIINI
ncbi:alcohol dehydrogenase-like 2 [Senna tora]|uniref:Alcohol dehydrogenase-like 2 n=1 Tax=Senna tora TaxID=362788 RepID=A0A834X1P7_9FABA|nr:alcohol dehydrogenase-like 2 [Senna tora]